MDPTATTTSSVDIPDGALAHSDDDFKYEEVEVLRSVAKIYTPCGNGVNAQAVNVAVSFAARMMTISAKTWI